MGPTWVLSAPDGPHVGPRNLAIRMVIAISITIFFNNMKGMKVLTLLSTTVHQLTKNMAVQNAFLISCMNLFHNGDRLSASIHLIKYDTAEISSLFFMCISSFMVMKLVISVPTTIVCQQYEGHASTGTPVHYHSQVEQKWGSSKGLFNFK